MINLEQAQIPLIPEGKYYNLKTHRLITKKQKDFILNEEYKVAGTSDMIKAFFTLNNFHDASVKFHEEHNNPVVIADIKVPLITSIDKRPEVEKAIGWLGKSDPISKKDETRVIAKTRDIEKIPDEVLNNLCSFNLAGLKTKAKVLRVIDGDTFDIAIYVPLSFLSERKTRYVGRSKKPVQEVYAIPYRESDGFFTMFNCRSNGVDAAEHDTVEGVWATMWYEKIFQRLNGIVYIEASIHDKYGRLIVSIYADEKMTIDITKMLNDCKCPYTGNVVCQGYDGGTKAPCMRELTKINSDEQREWRNKITIH